jgi:hypothetical protein
MSVYAEAARQSEGITADSHALEQAVTVLAARTAS